MSNKLPSFASPVVWDSQTSYEALKIVIYDGHAYTSKQAVPAGTQLSNTNYWYPTGNIYKTLSELSNSLTHNLMSYEDITVVTGSSQYVGYYYGDGTITTSVADKEIVSAFVYSATSNRPVFLQRIGATSLRAYCPVSDTTIVIRVLFKHN